MVGFVFALLVEEGQVCRELVRFQPGPAWSSNGVGKMVRPGPHQTAGLHLFQTLPPRPGRAGLALFQLPKQAEFAV